MVTTEACANRIKVILAEHPKGMSADDLCTELRRRWLAFDDLSPARLGFDGKAILRLITDGEHDDHPN